MVQMNMTDTNIGVYAVIKSEDGFVIVERNDGSRGLCGGRAKHGETLIEAMSRELREEIGLDPVFLRRTGVVQEFKSDRWEEYEKVSDKVPEGYERHYFFWCEVEETVEGNEEEPVKVGRKELVDSPFELRRKAKKEVLRRQEEGWKDKQKVFRS